MIILYLSLLILLYPSTTTFSVVGHAGTVSGMYFLWTGRFHIVFWSECLDIFFRASSLHLFPLVSNSHSYLFRKEILQIIFILLKILCIKGSFRCHKTFYTCLQIFYYNPESKEDIHLAHIELPITSPKTLTDPRAAIVFQPMARASPAHTKTNRRPVDQ